MYEILIQAVGAHVQTYDMEERFAGPDAFLPAAVPGWIRIFELYMKRKQTRESMVKGLFYPECIQYFLEGKEIDQTNFLDI